MARQHFGGKNENARADAAATERNAKIIFLNYHNFDTII
jgi:hypothetical protein